MDTLPLEVKQMICSCLTPKDLKSVRLTSNDLSDAATIHLIPRLFLFYHPDSCAEVKQIVEHPIFSNHVDTFVFDPSVLKEYRVVEQDFWARNTPGVTKASKAQFLWEMSCEPRWKAHRKMHACQHQPGLRHLVLESIARSFSVCPKLKNLIITTSHDVDGYEKKARIFKGVESDNYYDTWQHFEKISDCHFSLSDILSPSQSRVSLSSLSIIDAPLKSFSPPTSLSFQDLKHLRIGFYGDCRSPVIPELEITKLVKTASSLQTIRVDRSGLEGWFLGKGGFLKAINSSQLRDCRKLAFATSEDNLVDFLLRHASSLTQLGIGDCYLSRKNWSSTLKRVSCNLPRLKRIQLCGLHARSHLSMFYSHERLSTAYEINAARFIQYGGEAPEESLARDDSLGYFEARHELGVKDSEILIQNLDEGLWEDYEILSNRF